MDQNIPASLTSPQVESYVNGEGSLPSSPHKRKSIIILLVVLLLAGLGSGIWYLYKSGKINQGLNFFQTQKTSITPTPTIKQPTKIDTQLFTAVLEYDPKTNLVTQISTNKINGNPPYLFLTSPSPSPNKFIYRVEVTSNKDELLQSGWVSLAKEVILTNKKTYLLNVTCLFNQNGFIKIYLPNNQQIWTGKMT